MGRHQEAINTYDIVTKAVPQHALAWFNKGTSLASINNFEEADVMFTRALEIDSKYSQAYINRGNSRFMLQRFADAAADYSKVIAMQPSNADAHYNRAFSYQRIDRQSDACNDWRTAAGLGHKMAAEMLEKYCK